MDFYSYWNLFSRRDTAPTRSLYDETSITCRVGLTDIDINMHMNNAKYIKYMARVSLESMLDSGMFWKLLRARYKPVVTNHDISYIRELRPRQRFTVTSRFLGCDQRYLYLETRFLRDDLALCAHAFSRMACVQDGKARSMPGVFAQLGIEEPPSPLPEPVLQWKEFLDAKKRYTMNTVADTSDENRA